MSTATATRLLDDVEVPATGTWQIDPSHSAVAFTVRHLTVAKVRGRFGVFAGTLHIADAPQESWAEVSIDAASINTSEDKRDAHLRSPDFLDVERFSALTFRSSGVEIVSPRSFRLAGDLTIRDATRPIVLDVDYDGSTVDPWGNTRAVFTAKTEINREDFGLTWNQVLESGGLLVGKQVKIELEVSAIRSDLL